MMFRYRTGWAWRDLPEQFRPWQTVWKRHHRFSLDGTWDRLLTALQVQVDAAGELDWAVSTDLAVDGRGRPLAILVGPAQGGDSPMLAPLLASIRVPRLGPSRPRTRPQAVLADKAYSSRGHRADLGRRGITAVIPEPADQAAHRRGRGSRGGRPIAYDGTAYRRRNVIERAFGQPRLGAASPPATTSTPLPSTAQSPSPRS